MYMNMKWDYLYMTSFHEMFRKTRQHNTTQLTQSSVGGEGVVLIHVYKDKSDSEYTIHVYTVGLLVHAHVHVLHVSLESHLQGTHLEG